MRKLPVISQELKQVNCLRYITPLADAMPGTAVRRWC